MLERGRMKVYVLYETIYDHEDNIEKDTVKGVTANKDIADKWADRLIIRGGMDAREAMGFWYEEFELESVEKW